MAYGNGSDYRGDMDAKMASAQFIGGGSIGGGAISNAPPRMQAIPLELQRLNANTEQLHSLLSDLEQRTSAIVRPEGPNVAASADKQLPSMIPLAGGLAELNARMEGACRRLMSVIERIEL